MPQTIQPPDTKQPLRRRLIIIGALLAALMVSAAVLLSYRITPPPDNARIITDEQRFTYASTPCVIFNNLERELIANRREVNDPSRPLQLYSYANEKTMADVKSDKWTRDGNCNFATGFDQIVTVWMRLVGYRSRWADDGQWRW